MTTRRLLPPAELAKKLGYARLSADLLNRLDRAGFPQPVLGQGTANPKTQRWDERAVDLWLDARIPQELKDAPVRVEIDTSDMQARLAKRAQEIHL